MEFIEGKSNDSFVGDTVLSTLVWLDALVFFELDLLSEGQSTVA